MKLLLFGGTFDPPHNGHMRLLQSAIDAVQPDKVVVMPAGIPPHKAASATPASLRLTMCQCFAPLHPDLAVSDWEIGRGGKNYTIDTVRMLEERYPGAEIFLSVGSDMLTTFTQWREWQSLLQKTTLVVQSRYSGDAASLAAAAQKLEAAGGRVIFAHAPVLQAASSDVRAGKLGMDALPPLVQHICKQYHLYEKS
ncbi:nicotinate (nicotinamide) nucleotide adenylyltransferase [Allofournierella sp. CML151]|uniref:nicotinate (nicotinamide) nucleotide adenylyltransferase n=1 Tax=Allofournierella sp. CML151 TaxID=2998082 RepID=UPI0022EA2D07|nr:nicotinate (nicotinamide) nucleotide adenylyltransferase [Fournierella sp. CML151]